MKEGTIGIAVTVQVGSVAFTVEVKKRDPKSPPLQIETVKNGGYLDYKERAYDKT